MAKNSLLLHKFILVKGKMKDLKEFIIWLLRAYRSVIQIKERIWFPTFNSLEVALLSQLLQTDFKKNFLIWISLGWDQRWKFLQPTKKVKDQFQAGLEQQLWVLWKYLISLLYQESNMMSMELLTLKKDYDCFFNPLCGVHIIKTIKTFCYSK